MLNEVTALCGLIIKPAWCLLCIRSGSDELENYGGVVIIMLLQAGMYLTKLKMYI